MGFSASKLIRSQFVAANFECSPFVVWRLMSWREDASVDHGWDVARRQIVPAMSLGSVGSTRTSR